MNQSSLKDQRRMYGDLAWAWPIISPPQEYVEESEQFTKLIRKYSCIEVKTLLDLGCGAGHNDYTLKKYFQVTGVDVSGPMLKLAKRLNPEATYLVGDMRTIRLSKAFDAVTVFDSIDYMLTERELRSAFRTALAHLKLGGVFLTYQENDPERFRQSQIQYSTHRQGDIWITFIENNYDPDPTDTTRESTFVYLIRNRGQLRIETDRHVVGIFPRETWLTLLKETGFKVKRLDNSTSEGYSVFVCLRPS